MRESDTSLQETYAQFRANRSQPVVEQPQRGVVFSLVESLAQRLKRGYKDREELQRRVKEKQLRSQISEIIRNLPGHYPLDDIAFRPTPPLGHTGFTYSFERIIEEDRFIADFWSYNRWGILVQGHPSDYPPEVEIVERTIEPDNDSTEEDPEVGPYTVIDRILHLPEGFKIPVGPLHFEDDSLPINEAELAADKEQAIRMAKAAGIKINKEILEVADRMMGPVRKYPDRYFYWQPILPETPASIAIDFDSIDPRYMALVLEGAPVFSHTIVIPEEY